MIDYEVLCQTIEDWRAGRRPSIDLSAAPAAGYEQQPQYAEGYEQQPQYAEGYEQPQYAEGYEQQPQYAEPGQEQPYADQNYQQMPADQSYEQLPAEPYEDYEQPQYAEGYEQPEGGYEEYDGVPEPAAAGGTDPVNVADIADVDEDEYQS